MLSLIPLFYLFCVTYWPLWQLAFYYLYFQQYYSTVSYRKLFLKTLKSPKPLSCQTENNNTFCFFLLCPGTWIRLPSQVISGSVWFNRWRLAQQRHRIISINASHVLRFENVRLTWFRAFIPKQSPLSFRSLFRQLWGSCQTAAVRSVVVWGCFHTDCWCFQWAAWTSCSSVSGLAAERSGHFNKS